MARKPKPKPDDAEQSKRFEETAHELGADEDDGVFERAIDSLLPPQKKRTDSNDSAQIAMPRKRKN